MIETTSKKILDLLTKDYGFHTSEDIGRALGVSDKTAQKEINRLNEIVCSNGANIKSIPSKGYKFVIDDEDKFQNFLKDKWYKYAFYQHPGATKETRVNNILRLILLSNDYIKQEELAKIFYVSPSQINKDIREVRDILNDFKLDLVSKPYYGMAVEGEEKNIRLCLKGTFEASRDLVINEEDRELFERIELIVNNIDYGRGYYMSYLNAKNLTTHIFISLLRIREGYIIEINNDIKNELANDEEFKIAQKLVEALKKELDIDFSFEEMLYLTMHLVSKKSLRGYDEINNEAAYLAQEIIDRIFETSKYDFRHDVDLFLNLGMHLTPLIERIKYGLILRNPILNDIKENRIPYMLATLASDVINQRYNTVLSEDEIGYIALHIMAAMEVKEDERKDILIICASGHSSSQIMKSQLLNQFGMSIEKVDITDLNELEKYDLDSYDFVISSVDIDLATTKPVIYVDIIFKAKDIDNISRALDNDGNLEADKILDNSVFIKNNDLSDKDTALDFVAEIASKKTGMVKDVILEQLYEREDLGSTAFDNKVAIPHMLEQVNTATFMVVIASEKSVVWDNKKINLIISLFIGDEIGEMTTFYYKLGSFLANDYFIKLASKSANKNEFTEIWKEIR